jgi:hypothetical protein
MNHEGSIEWLRKRTEEYRSTRSGMGEVVEDLDEMGKLGSRFLSLDELVEANIGQDGVTRPTYVNTNLARCAVCFMSFLIASRGVTRRCRVSARVW